MMAGRRMSAVVLLAALAFVFLGVVGARLAAAEKAFGYNVLGLQRGRFQKTVLIPTAGENLAATLAGNVTVCFWFYNLYTRTVMHYVSYCRETDEDEQITCLAICTKLECL